MQSTFKIEEDYKSEKFLHFLLDNKIEAIVLSLQGKLPATVTRTLLLVSILSYGIFGFLIGSSHSIQQGAVSMIKLPALFYLTSGICLPTLYLFLALIGLKYSFKGITQFMLLCLTLSSLILLAFSPVSLFFLVLSTDYEVFKLINVGILAISGFSGVYLFNKYVFANIPEEFTHVQKSRARLFVRAWLLMYAIIGANLGFAISPVFGNPTLKFMLFTSSHQNFFSHIIHIFF